MKRLDTSYIIKAMRSVGSHFFDETSIRFFNSRLHCAYEMNDGTYAFITSEQQDVMHKRMFTVRLWDGKSKGVGSFPCFQAYVTLDAAEAALADIARWGSV